MNNIFTGKTNSKSSKFQTTVGNKTFYYDGYCDDGYFLEEIVWNALRQTGNMPTQDIVEVLVHFSTKNYYIVFGDEYNNSGEETLVFDMEQLNENQMAELLSEQVLNPEFIIEASFDGKTFSINDSDEESSIALDRLNIEKKITRARAFKKIFNEQKINILGILLIIFLPYSSYIYANKIIVNNTEKQVRKISMEISKYAIKKRELERKVRKAKNNIKELKNSSDLISNGMLNSSIKNIYSTK